MYLGFIIKKVVGYINYLGYWNFLEVKILEKIKGSRINLGIVWNIKRINKKYYDLIGCIVLK